MSNQSTQKRQYDSFGPHFRIETGNPQLGVAGNICYNLYGYSDSSDVTNIGMMGDGQLQIMADQCITIDGGASVEGGGCSGMNYKMNKLERELESDDKVIKEGELELIVPFNSYIYLLGTQIDFSDDLLNGGFKFDNPNAERSCGCGTSFSV